MHALDPKGVTYHPKITKCFFHIKNSMPPFCLMISTKALARNTLRHFFSKLIIVPYCKLIKSYK